ncbi:prepilin-type N-terminal cleavage/methylation domain-containing protein [Patescibacteria group bacterium]
MRKLFKNHLLGRGFTLIELILVSSVIVIIVGIVFISLGPIKQRAKEASIKSSLNELQNVAERIYFEEGNYEKVYDTTDDVRLLTIKNNILDQGETLVMNHGSSAYCAYAMLDSPSGSPVSYCVDHLGYADEIPFNDPEIPCDVRAFCNYKLCADYNENYVVECGFEPAYNYSNPITEDPINNCPPAPTDMNGDNRITADEYDERFVGSDILCVINCYYIEDSGPRPECGAGFCADCFTTDQCLWIYDFNLDRKVRVDDILAATQGIGTPCQEVYE